MRLARTRIDTPLGAMVALASSEGLCALEFSSPGERLAHLDARVARWFPAHEVVDSDEPTLARTRAWLTAYFDGTSADIGDLPLDLRGTPFELRVWTALRAIPPGRTTSYAAIAASVGSPGAARGVGAANGANPAAIVVPCHRVIGASGDLVGYGGGLDRKRWLLEHERRWGTDRLF